MQSLSLQSQTSLLTPSGKLFRGLTPLALVAAFLLGGCSTPVNQTVSFNEADYKPYEAAGTAVIHGHAFVRSDTGVKHGAAGINIYLVPLTAYTEERAKIMESGKEPAGADPRLENYIKTTVGDWGGDYKFEGLPAGKYLLYCKIDWEQQYPNSMRRAGSGEVYAVARAQVSNGEHKSVVVTNPGRK
jgi:hypothetical protein